jgi:hypothetical protein
MRNNSKCHQTNDNQCSVGLDGESRASVAKIIGGLEHIIVSVERHERHDVVVASVAATDFIRLRVRESVFVLPQPFLQDAVNVGVVVDEDWIIRRSRYTRHYTLLFKFRYHTHLQVT